MNDSEEAALIRRCQSGDTEAFRMLVERYRTALFGTAYLMTHNRSLSEDMVQESLVQIWKHLPSLRLQGSLKPWLLRIVVNEVKQQFRKRRVPTVSLDQFDSQDLDPDKGEIALVRREERQLITMALRELTPEQKEMVILRYFSELTIPEIAVVTGVREGTVKSRLSRALDHMEEILRKEGSGGGESI